MSSFLYRLAVGLSCSCWPGDRGGYRGSGRDDIDSCADRIRRSVLSPAT